MQPPEETTPPSADAGVTDAPRPVARQPRRRPQATVRPTVDAPVEPPLAAADEDAADPESVVEPEPAAPANDRLMAEWQDALRHATQPIAEVTEARAAAPALGVVPPAAPIRAPRDDAPVAERPNATETVLQVTGLVKRFGSTTAVDGIDLAVQAGSFFGIVGPNGAGKTTTLSMVTGLLRPDEGTVLVHGIDVWQAPERAKRAIGVLPDSLRLFDRLTGAQLLYYSGVLRGLPAAEVRTRSADLVEAFGLEDATGRLVADYSAGMTKKIALAAAMIHSPRLLVLDEPFESVDPVSATNIIDILQRYVHSGGTVVLSSHGMDLIQRVCDHVAVVIAGQIKAIGTTDEVRGDQSLEERFVQLAGGYRAAQGMEWLHSFVD